MQRVILESPYAAPTPEGVAQHVAYARRALRDCLRRGEAPIASHLLLTQVLDDTVPADRALGIAAGLAWGRVADATVVYVDLGISPGMKQGITDAMWHGRPVLARWLDGPVQAELRATPAAPHPGVAAQAADDVVAAIAQAQRQIDAEAATQHVVIDLEV